MNCTYSYYTAVVEGIEFYCQYVFIPFQAEILEGDMAGPAEPAQLEDLQVFMMQFRAANGEYINMTELLDAWVINNIETQIFEVHNEQRD